MLFDCYASMTQMSSLVYAEHMNCDYNHALNDADLFDTINSLLARNLIHLIGNSGNSKAPIYSLTASGGKLWELERRPNWNRYVSTSQKLLGSFLVGSIVATCVTELVGRQCLGSMFASGLITPIRSIRTRQLSEKRLVPWKTFPSIYAVRCRTSDDGRDLLSSVESEVYDSSRCWWRSIDELLTLPS